jgi:hypothetical protein
MKDVSLVEAKQGNLWSVALQLTSEKKCAKRVSRSAPVHFGSSLQNKLTDAERETGIDQVDWSDVQSHGNE